MNKQLFKEYADLKTQVKELEEKIKELQPQVLKEMADNEEVESEYGVFSKGHRRTWTYPEDIAMADEKLKADKKIAEQTGTATYEEKEYLIFSK